MGKKKRNVNTLQVNFTSNSPGTIRVNFINRITVYSIDFLLFPNASSLTSAHVTSEELGNYLPPIDVLGISCKDKIVISGSANTIRFQNYTAWTANVGGDKNNKCKFSTWYLDFNSNVQGTFYIRIVYE